MVDPNTPGGWDRVESAARAFGANYNVAYRIRTGRTWVTA